MTLSDFKKLAQAATHYDYCGQDECSICEAERQMHSALSPERILAMIAVIDAADAMRQSPVSYDAGKYAERQVSHADIESYDAARAALEQQE